MKSKKKVLVTIAFGAYVVLMLWFLFGLRLDRLRGGFDWNAIKYNINLIPFRTISVYARELFTPANGNAVINLIGNIVMFAPLGFFLPAVFRSADSFRCTMLLSCLSVGVVEVIQLVTLLGSMDIDDLILNLIGAALGYAAWRVLQWLRKKEPKRKP